MSRSTATQVYVTAGLKALPLQARKVLAKGLRRRHITDGHVSPVWVTFTEMDLQLRNSMKLPIGYIGIDIKGGSAAHTTTMYAVVSFPAREERINAIALRTALLQTYNDDAVAIYMTGGTTINVFMDEVTGFVKNTWTDDSLIVMDPNSDIFKECAALVSMRKLCGKTTHVSSVPSDWDRATVSKVQMHLQEIDNGTVHFVLKDSGLQQDISCDERIENAALQLQVDVLPRKPSTSTQQVTDVLHTEAVSVATDKVEPVNDQVEQRGNKPKVFILCSSCMDLVQVTRHLPTNPSASNAFVTMQCSTCAVANIETVRLRPVVVKKLACYGILLTPDVGSINVATEDAYVKHVDRDSMLKSITKDHSIATFDHETGLMVEFRGGFF